MVFHLETQLLWKNLKEINMYIFGASGHGKVLASMLKDMNVEIQGFIDDAPKTDSWYNLPVINSKNFQKLSISKFVIGIGDNSDRKSCALKYVTNFISIVHPSAIINNSVTVKEGTVIMPGVVINVDAQIGKHCIINTGAVVEHDCKIDDFVHISPKAAIAGGVFVGEGTHIGIGASVIPGVSIGKWAVIGAGTVVIKDVPDGAVVVGVPGKIIKMNQI